MGSYKSTLAEVEVGDTIIIVRNSMKTAVVTKVTKTQISVGDSRFQRDGGRLVGADKGDVTRAHAPLEIYWKTDEGSETYYDKMCANRRAAAIARSAAIEEITQKLSGMSNSHLEYITDFIRTRSKQ